MSSINMINDISMNNSDKIIGNDNLENFLFEKIFTTHYNFDNSKYQIEVLTKYIIYYENNDFVLNIYRSENWNNESNDPYYLIDEIYLSRAYYNDMQYFDDLHQFFLDTSLLDAYEKRVSEIKHTNEYNILSDEKRKEIELIYNKDNSMDDNIEIVKKLIIKKESIMLSIFLEEYVSLDRDQLGGKCIKELIKLGVDNRCIDEVLLIVNYILYKDGEDWYDYDGHRFHSYRHKEYIMIDDLLTMIIDTDDIDYIKKIIIKLIKNVGIKEIQSNCKYFDYNNKDLYNFYVEQGLLILDDHTW
jgi:hypothetical protein